MIGSTVSHYTIVDKLGRGGMGEVWKAQDSRLDRFVALKFVPESVAQDPAMVERFLREARAASALNHPHICTIHDIGEWQGRRFIVMELIEGVTLAQASSGQPLDTETIVDVGIQIGDALDAAHAKNIIHRDIKANNILLTPRGQAKILDFGLAKITAKGPAPAGEDDQTIGMERDLTDAGHAVGTVGYMAPEQALGKDVDGRADIFSLGVVLYELSTSRKPFPGSTSAAVFDAILNKAPVAPVSLNPALPAELQRIINKMLEKDRTMRYQSAAEVVTDLKRMRRDSGSQVSAALPAPAPKRVGWVPIGAGAAVVALAVIGYFVFGRGPALPTGPVTTKPLTSLVGMESSGTWSPDGGFIAYGYSDAGPQDIFVVATGGGDPIKLVDSPADDGYPRWSPDNRWIAFTSGRGGAAAIYLIPPLGGAVQKFVDLETSSLYSEPGMGSNPWSPDGRTFVFDRQDSTGRRLIWKKDVESRVETPFTSPGAGENDLEASWSFDGRHIAFIRQSDAGSSLMTIPAAGGTPRAVLSDSHLNEGPAWSPDGRSLVFESNRGGNRDLWQIAIGSRTPRQLTSSPLSEEDPAVSRTGRLLYNTFDHQTDLYMRDMDRGEERRLTSHTHNNFTGRLSPDGNHIVYESSRTGRNEIWTIDLDSGEEHRLTNGPGESYSPDWSPDGRRIAFISEREGLPRLWVMGADGDAPRRLSDRKARWPALWSPDGTAIGFISTPSNPTTSGRGDQAAVLCVVGPDGGETREVLADVVEFDWYRDAGRVVATLNAPGSRGELYAVRLRDGAKTLLSRESLIEPVVNHDGTALSYCSATSHFNMNLHVLRLVPPASADGLPTAAGAAVEITHGNGKWHVHNGSWSRDGRRTVYTRDTDSGDLTALDGVFGK